MDQNGTGFPEKPAHAPNIPRWLASGCLLIAVLLTSVHPVSSDQLWWDLSTGRAVAEGSVSPAQDLLAADVRSDATWLGGLGIYLLYSTTGFLGLMLFKLAAALTVVRIAYRSAIDPTPLLVAVLVMATLCARTAWEPSLLGIDALGVVLVVMAGSDWSCRPDWKRLIVLLLLMFMWANSGPRCVVGLAIAVAFAATAPARWPVRLMAVIALVAACCVTPSGWQTVLDSVWTTVPQTAEQPEVLRLTGWHPWWDASERSDVFVFAVLSGLFLAHSLANGSNTSLIVFAAAQCLAGAAVQNVPLAAVMMALFAGRNQGVGVHVVPSRFDRLLKCVQLSLPAASIAAVFLVAGRPWPGCGSGPGWGLDPQLYPEAFGASVRSVRLTGVAHCVGIREAGLLTWHIPEGIRPYDTPRSAFLNGRLKDHVLLTSDLSKGWQVSHRRSEAEEWGGWWLTVRKLGITALVVPSEDHSLISGLEPSLWKPLSLSSVSIPYGKAGDPGVTGQIVQTLSLRQFVDRGTWTWQASAADTANHVDLFATVLQRPAFQERLRQAGVFRAMKLNIAALKVLASISVRSAPEIQREFAANQMALGFLERVDAGRSSRFRHDAWMLSTANLTQQPQQALDVLGWETAGESPFAEAIADYLAGDLNAALEKLNFELPESIFGGAMLLLELGKTEECSRLLNRLIADFPEHRLNAAAQKYAASLVY